MTQALVPRCGDTVRHRPTGEQWLVAYADPTTGDLAWVGWPEGRAQLSDCDLVARASDAVHVRWVNRIARVGSRDNGSPDHRAGAVRRLYPDAWRDDWTDDEASS